MSRVVVDTNVFISALMFGGAPGTFLNIALNGAFALVTSSILLDELIDKLQQKFHVAEEDAAAIRARLEGVAEIVEPDSTIQVIAADPDDDRVLECAVKGRADFIVSGDRHLLNLGAYEFIPIMTTRQFLDGFQQT